MSGPKGLYQNKQNVFESLTNILNFLSLSSEDKCLESDFAEAFEIRDFQLGDYLHSYIATDTPENSVQDEHTRGFFLICQGRVRLLGFDTTQGREASVMVLEAGESFGSESLFTYIPSLTRVIAASEGQLAWMPIAQLQSWLDKLPNLRQRLLESTQNRQSLVFFKTATQLRRLPMASLKQVLPYIKETRIQAKEALVKSSDSGRFWLRSGEIVKGEQITTSIAGESWGYPDSIPTEWIAKTDLSVYKLPKQDWAAVASLGVDLDSQNSKLITAASGNGGVAGKSNAGVAKKLKARPPSTVNKKIPPKPPTPASNTESEQIDFPQPTRLPRRRGFWRRYPFIQQHSSSDCGAACLAMVGRYWGKRFNLNSLRELAGVGRSGASLKGLARAAESLGFRASPVRASLSRLVEQENPWIAHWQGDHYIVVYRVKGDALLRADALRDRVILADPALGLRSLSKQEFIDNWTGYALLLDPTVQLAAAKDEKISLNRFWGLLWPHRGILLQVVMASLLLQVFGLITPLFTQIILDRVIVNKSLITLQVIAVGLVIFGLWSIGISATRRYLMDYYSNRLSLTFLSGFMNHTLRLPLKFFESRQVGDIITRVQETKKIQSFITKQAISTWLDVLMLFVSTGLMLYYNWQLTLLVLSTIPPIAILTVVASPFLRQLSREIFKASAEQNSKLVEMMSGVATVKASAAEQEVRWRWEELLTNQFNVKFKAQKLSNGLRSVSGFFKTISSTVLLAYGANLVISDQLTIGQFVAFNMLIGRVTGPVLKLVGLWDQFQEILVSVERLNDVFATQPEENIREPMLALPPIKGDVLLENVTFRYSEEEGKNTLQNICLEVKAGETIAIVGRSGSGKSTLVKLFQALYHPTEGRICIDDHDIKHVSPESLRSQLGVVPQECFLFSGTILENILLYRPEFNLDQAIEAAKLAEAHAFIQSLPLGYNTKVGERGTTLSGGQRQRIAIARALLGNPRILLLDEATSSLDTESERRFQQNLARISRERTTFIIAHRLSTVRNADCILVLDKGILAEQGNHEQLMALEGIYYHLARQQLEL